MFEFYNKKKQNNFWEIYSAFEYFFQMEEKEYRINLDFYLKDEELEIGNLFLAIEEKDTSKLVYQTNLFVTREMAFKIIDKLQREFLKKYPLILPYFLTNEQNNKKISYHLKSTHLELVQGIHDKQDLIHATKIRDLAMLEQGKKKKKLLGNEKEYVSTLESLIFMILEDCSKDEHSYKIYFSKFDNFLFIQMKNELGEVKFSHKFKMEEEISRKVINEIRNHFIEKHYISLPSMQLEENHIYTHHIQNTKFELIIPMLTHQDEKDAYIAQKLALVKLGQEIDHKIYQKRTFQI